MAPESPYPVPPPIPLPPGLIGPPSPVPVMPSLPQLLANLQSGARRVVPAGEAPTANVHCDNFHDKDYRELYNRVQKINATGEGVSVQTSVHAMSTAAGNAQKKIETLLDTFAKAVNKSLPEKWNSAAGRAVLAGSVGYATDAKAIVTTMAGITSTLGSLDSALNATKTGVKHPADFQWYNWTSVTDNVLGLFGKDDHRKKVAQSETNKIITTLREVYWPGVNGTTNLPTIPAPTATIKADDGAGITSPGTTPGGTTPGGGTTDPTANPTTPGNQAPGATNPAGTTPNANSGTSSTDDAADAKTAPWMDPANTAAASAAGSPFTAAPGLGSGSGSGGSGAGGGSGSAPGVLPAPAPLAATTGSGVAGSRVGAAGAGRPGAGGMGGMMPPGAGGKKDEDKEHQAKIDLPPDEDAFNYLDAGNQQAAAPPVILPPWLKEDPG